MILTILTREIHKSGELGIQQEFQANIDLDLFLHVPDQQSFCQQLIDRSCGKNAYQVVSFRLNHSPMIKIKDELVESVLIETSHRIKN